MIKVLVNDQREHPSSFTPLTPFPSRGFHARAVGTVRTPSGRRERPRGRTDPPDGSPGPSGHRLGGPQRTFVPKHPNSAPFDHKAAMSMSVPIAHSAPVKCDLRLSNAAADAAPSSIHVVESAMRGVSDGSEAFPANLDWLDG